MAALQDFLIGDSRRGNAGSPMGVLVAHGLVDERIMDQVTTPYSRAKKLCFGSYGPAMAGDGTEHGHTGNGSDDAEQRARHVIERCDKVLKQLRYDSSRAMFDAFVVRETFPVWMLPRPGVHDFVVDPRTGAVRYTRRLRIDRDNVELLLLQEILGRLAAVHKIRTDRSVDTNVVPHPFQQPDPNHGR